MEKGLRRGAMVLPATPTPPINRPLRNSGTPPGEPARPVNAANAPSDVLSSTSGAPLVPLASDPTSRPILGFLNRLTSVNDRFEKFTPTNGPAGRLRTPGGKFCCTMKPAVRDV